MVESALPEAMAEIGKGAMGRYLQEIESTNETEPGVVEQRRGKLTIGLNLA